MWDFALLLCKICNNSYYNIYTSRETMNSISGCQAKYSDVICVTELLLLGMQPGCKLVLLLHPLSSI